MIQHSVSHTLSHMGGLDPAKMPAARCGPGGGGHSATLGEINFQECHVHCSSTTAAISTRHSSSDPKAADCICSCLSTICPLTPGGRDRELCQRFTPNMQGGGHMWGTQTHTMHRPEPRSETTLARKWPPMTRGAERSLSIAAPEPLPPMPLIRSVSTLPH